MSDHEGGGFDDWDEDFLTAPPLLHAAPESLSSVVHDPSGPGKAGLVVNSHNQNWSSQQRYNNNYNSHNNLNIATEPRNNVRNKQPQIPNDYRPQIQGILNRHGGIRERQLRWENRITNAGRDLFDSGVPAAGEYTFSVTWKTLLFNIRTDEGCAAKPAREKLNQICLKTETYIPTPAIDELTAQIWGSEANVAAAKAQLDHLEMEIRNSESRPARENWARTRALDGRTEHRAERKKEVERYAEHLQASERLLEYEVELYILWPAGIGLDDFKAEYDDELMSTLRIRYGCLVEYDDLTSMIHISMNDQKLAVDLYKRIVNLSKEMVAKLNQCHRRNLIRLPSASMYRSKVGVDQDPTTSLFLPTPHGAPLPPEETDNWTALAENMQRKARRDIAASIDKSLKSLQFSNKHVRMRVTFGELGFSRHRKPQDGEAHGFDEFCEMVRDERTQLCMQGIRTTNRNILGLVDQLEKMEEFGPPELSYSIYCDFQAPGQNKTLRLETEFAIGANLKELELSQQRWLEFKTGEEDEVLEINMLDFERPNWQMHIGAVGFCDNKQTKNHMEHFKRNIGLRAPGNGIKAVPQRRAIFPSAQSGLRQVSELIFMRYRFKQTDGTFELRRRDFFDEEPGRVSPKPSSSIWTAAYYYPEWDNLLGEFANTKPGESVSWIRSLATFFPDSEDATRPDGFKKFMKEIEGIQDLLAIAIAELPQGFVHEDGGSTTVA